MRILLLGPLPPPVGGMATVVDNLQRSLSTEHEVRVHDNRKSTAPGRSLWQGIRAQLKLLWRLVAEIIRFKPDLVHIHTCSYNTFWRNGLDVLAVRLLGRKVVLHIHGGMFHRFLGGLGFIKRQLARSVFHLSHRVIALGEQWRKVLIPWVGEEKITVVPNGVPVPKHPVNISVRPYHILCFANYERNKGQADLLQALAALDRKNVRLGLYGFESEPDEQRRLQELANELGLGDRVEIPGPVMGEDKQAVMQEASLFVLPSYDEGLPMAMLEAMAAGLPVIVTRVGSIAEAVRDGRDGLIYQPGDIPSLQGMLEQLIDNPDLAAGIARAGRRRVMDEFSIDHSTRLLNRLYRDLA